MTMLVHYDFFEVILPIPLRQPLIYHVSPDKMGQAVPGMAVKVPLGKRHAVGFLLDQVQKPGFPTKEIGEILLDRPALSSSQIRLLKWASAYYLTPPGEVLRHLVPPRLFQLRLKSGNNPQKVKALPDLKDFLDSRSVVLTHRQKEITKSILDGINGYLPVLLHGITGSGKTEIYIEIVRHILSQGGQALVLVPEIGLTPQLLGRFQSSLASHAEGTIAAYHSGLTPAQRFQIWRGVQEGRFPIVIATRSGIFLPFPKLSMVIIDEEHDTSYKQEERFCYHARDLALWRSHEEKFSILLGSATPSLESLQRVQKDKMKLLTLMERPHRVILPTMEVIDRRQTSQKYQDKDAHPLLSERLLQALEYNLKKKEQSLLFLNRRGFSPFVLCPRCGHIPRCKSCDISLTLHSRKEEKRISQLICHYCDHEESFHPVCPTCHEGTLQSLGFGTERIHLDLQKLFPGARIERMDRDTTRGDRWLKILERMKRQEIDILIGTQMITKGHDYPNLTLVGILDADVLLNLPDFRASERTFQILTQVAGRAGRAEKQGRVLIQTYHPDHESLRAIITSQGGAFYERESRIRSDANYPPFNRLIEVRLSGTVRKTVIENARLLSKKIRARIPSPQGQRLAILLGPTPCMIEKVRNHIRWRLLLKTSAYTKIQPALSHLLDDFVENDLPSGLRLLVNVDPVDMM